MASELPTVPDPQPEITSDPAHLPVLGSAPHERADAARNRRRVLDAAARLFERDGAAHVSMDAVAAAAGVGKGTLFRRFGDRASLARSVLSERERRLQEALIRGPAPLGPGAPPLERLCAFGSAYLEFLEGNVDILLAAEYGAPGFRFAGPPYVFYRTHVTMLLREAGLGDDAEFLADVLLAPLAASAFRYHRHVRGLPLATLDERYRSLVRRLLSCR
jgi:AcrR family transcriptional regulator